MSAPYWPLDQALLLPFDRVLPSRLIVSPVEDAAPKVRLRHLAAAGRMEGNLRLTGSEWRTLQDFGEVVLVKWSQPFTWADPLDGMVREMFFLREPGPPRLEGDASEQLNTDLTVWLIPIVLAVVE